jgi:hypothetical protein
VQESWKTLVNLGTNLGKPWSTLVLDDVVRYGRCADTKTGYNLNADALHTIALLFRHVYDLSLLSIVRMTFAIPSSEQR